MKKLLLLSLLFMGLTSINLYAQNSRIKGSGNITKESRTVGDFTGVSVGGSMNVIIKSGMEQSVVVETDDNLQEYIETTVKDGQLIISNKKIWNLSYSKSATVYITNPVLDKARLSGSGSIITEGVMKSSGKFEASISGSGKIVASINASETLANISGSGNIELEGKTDALDVAISGSGSFKGYELKANKTSASISGSGNVQTTAKGKLEASIAGSGNVYYKGNGEVISRTAGSGKVRKVN
jgi:hypothetical protein